MRTRSYHPGISDLLVAGTLMLALAAGEAQAAPEPQAAAPAAPTAPAVPGGEAKASPAPPNNRLPVAPVDPKSPAGRILADVVAALDTATAAESATKLTVSRPVTALQSGEVVTLTFPGLQLILDAESTLDIGDLQLDVSPKPDARYAFRLALPSEIVGYTKGEPDIRVTLTAEPVTGVWAPGLGTFLRLYVNLRDLRFENIVPEPSLLMSIAGLTAEQRGDGDEQRLSGDFRLDLRDILANDETQTQQVRIGRLAVTTHALDFDVALWRRISDALQADPADANGVASQATLDLLAAGRWAKLGSSLELGDIEFSEEGNLLAALGGLHVGFDIDGRPQSGATMTVKAGLDKLRVDEVPYGNLPADMVPHSFVVDAALEGLPLQAMAAAALRPRPSGEEAPSAQDAATAEMLNALPTLNITRAMLASEQLQMSLAGALVLDSLSSFGNGVLNLKIAGLDHVKAYLDRESKKDKDLRQYIPALALLRGLGADARLAGAQAKEYTLVAGKDGILTINGTPWQALLEAEEKPKRKSKDKAKDKKPPM